MHVTDQLGPEGGPPGGRGASTRAPTVGWGVALVAGAAALWGTDGVLRTGLASELPASTVVFWEHAVLVAVTSPALVRGARAAAGLGPRLWAALLVIGVGASATATVLFTAAFQLGDPTTPLLLQKLQPVLAVAAAAWLLGERLRPRFGLLALVAVGGAWLITFPDPLAVSARAGAAAALAVGAAALWAAGTVLGRLLTAHLPPAELTALRFGIGLPAAGVLVLAQEGRGGFAIAGGDVVPLLVLALVPGLLALTLYYRGLATTPASLATLAELAFPLSAIVVNGIVLGATVSGSQVAGVVVLAGVLIVMGGGVRTRGAPALGVVERRRTVTG